MKTNAILFCTLLLSFSCSESNKPEAKQNSTQETREQNENSATLVLNSGEKWQANPETTAGIEQMNLILSQFSETESQEAYQALSDTLRSEFNLIFKRCTMKGAAHDQLHNFLYPMLALLKQLGDADLSKNKKALSELADHIRKYNTFFE